ncbi:MAG: flippase-like domain-containing protein [Candidatus Methanoperedens sp.]|nr:flippase-like domain-containing protein [Candidatus Methanoperedens sp.]
MNRKIKSAIGIGISVVLIWLVFKGTNWSEFIRVIQNINYFVLIAAMIILISSVWIRAIRWRILISNVGNVSTKDLYKVNMVGFMGNNILPFKMGELLRAYVISKKQNIIFTGALTSLIVERIVDLISFILIVSGILLIFPITDWARKTAIIGFLIVICFFIFSLVLIKYNSKFETWYLKKQKQLIAKDKETMSNHFVGFCRGIKSLWQNPKPLQTVFLSLLIWVMYFIFTILSIYSFNFDLSFLDIMKAGILVLSFVTLAVIVPSAPGYIGTYQAATIAALQVVYINIDAARAFAIMYHLAQYIPLTFIGLYYFFKLNLHIADLDKV